MIACDLNFYDCDPHEDSELVPDSEESSMKIVRLRAHAMCDGQIPGEPSLRLGLLFSAVAKLALECDKAVRDARQEVPSQQHHMIDEKANIAMAMIVAAATQWAEVVGENSNAIASFGDD